MPVCVANCNDTPLEVTLADDACLGLRNCSPDEPLQIAFSSEQCFGVKNCPDGSSLDVSGTVTVQPPEGGFDVNLSNKDDEPLKVCAEVSGCMAIKNCCEEDFHICGDVCATVDGFLEIEPKDENGFLIQGTVSIENSESDPFYVDACVCAKVHGCMEVHNDEDDPLHVESCVHGSLCVEGCLGIENAGTEPLYVALENKHDEPLKIGGSVKFGWDKDCPDHVPVYGQFEVCNGCDDKPLKVEMVGLQDILTQLTTIVDRLSQVEPN